ncbi:hypothetical protein MMSR116_15765 [Methylobacterium mesophilicum SR1.6/6]|uniref:Uncharacterized protein n=1 Tax=Methylobacterium mesophilicum SR1.6/6 TaxID=908290 RepID=A0A6B9FQ81_9HYPH|nr:hypothetical protein MMSR116_15765 [Methylobacterium mesophilicum SR1.6/6]
MRSLSMPACPTWLSAVKKVVMGKPPSHSRTRVSGFPDDGLAQANRRFARRKAVLMGAGWLKPGQPARIGQRGG